MDAAGIEQAYEPFLEAYQAGGFRPAPPGDGWSAEMVVAHVTLTNDDWTRVARHFPHR